MAMFGCTDDIYISNGLTKTGRARLTVTGYQDDDENEEFINKQDAIAIINHLKKLFDIEDE